MNEKLRQVLDHEIERSVTWSTSAIRSEQERNLAYYLGLPLGNEVEGRSQVVSWDVFEVVESALPSFLEPLFGGDNIAEFQPRGPEDEAFASQATDYVNYLVTERNDGFMVFYTWLKDALLQKLGVVRPEWVKVDPERTEYEGLTAEQLTMMQAEGKVIVAASERIVDFGGMPAPVYDVTVETQNPGKLCIRNVKPVDFIITKDARTPDDAYVIGEMVTYTRSELKEMGFKRWADVSDYDFSTLVDDPWEDDVFDGTVTVELEEVRLFKGFVRCDCNGDGVAEWREVLVGGGPDDILQDDEAEGQDYAVITPIPIPHRVYGMAYADPAAEIQRLKTGLTRQYVDSLYLANRPGTYINMQAATANTIEDLLSDRIGKIIRGNGPANTAITPIQTTIVARESLEGIQFADTMRETRLGITKYNQGLDSESLNKTATGIGKIMQASEQRLKMTLRIMANTGIKRLYQIILRLVTQHQNVADVVRLRNEWVPFNPAEWSDKMDCKIVVGSTNGERMEEVQMLQLFGQFMQQAVPMGVATKQNVYEFGKRLARAAKLMGADVKLLTDPAQSPPQQPQPSPEQIKAQIEMGKAQFEAQEAEKQRQHDLQMKQLEGQQAERLKLFELAAGMLSRPMGGNIINGTQMDQAGQVIGPAQIQFAAQAINQLANDLQQPGAM